MTDGREETRFDFLGGRTVEQIWFWGETVRLVLTHDPDFEAETYADVHVADLFDRGEVSARIDVGEAPEEAGAVLRLLRVRLVDASARDGVLTLLFDGGEELRAYPSPDFESWTVTGNEGTFQCLPGGDVDSL